MPARVLIVEASSGGVVGGSLTGFVHLARGLDRARFSVAMALYETKSIEPELAELGVDVYHVQRRRIPKQHALLHSSGYQSAKRISAVKGALKGARQTVRLVAEEMPAARQLARIIRDGKIDVLHLGNGVRANFDAILAGWMTRTPIVCHVKGFEKYSKRESWAARRLEALISMTEAIASHCRENDIIARHNQVIYDAVDPKWLEPSKDRSTVRHELGVTEDTPLIALSGNIQEWKGQAVLVEAMGRIAKQHPTAQCLIVGGVHRAGAEYAERLHQRVDELGLTDNVRFLGFRDDIPDLMNAIDIVVHASVRPEPFGRVILEGMLAGRLVIAANAGGVRELIRDQETGFLVDPGDDVSLAARLDDALTSPERAAALGNRAREWAQQTFSLDRHVEEMGAVYELAMRKEAK